MKFVFLNVIIATELKVRGKMTYVLFNVNCRTNVRRYEQYQLESKLSPESALLPLTFSLPFFLLKSHNCKEL